MVSFSRAPAASGSCRVSRGAREPPSPSCGFPEPSQQPPARPSRHPAAILSPPTTRLDGAGLSARPLLRHRPLLFRALPREKRQSGFRERLRAAAGVAWRKEWRPPEGQGWPSGPPQSEAAGLRRTLGHRWGGDRPVEEPSGLDERPRRSWRGVSGTQIGGQRNDRSSGSGSSFHPREAEARHEKAAGRKRWRRSTRRPSRPVYII